MKSKKVTKLITKVIKIPLRFHHQDLHEELDLIKQDLARIEGLLLALKDRKDI